MLTPVMADMRTRLSCHGRFLAYVVTRVVSRVLPLHGHGGLQTRSRPPSTPGEAAGETSLLQPLPGSVPASQGLSPDATQNSGQEVPQSGAIHSGIALGLLGVMKEANVVP